MGWPVLDYAPAAAGRLFLAIAQNGGLAGLGWLGWAGLGWLTEVAARCRAVFPRSCGCGLRAANCGAAANNDLAAQMDKACFSFLFHCSML